MPPKSRKQIQDEINAGLQSSSDIATGLGKVLQKELKTRKRLNQSIRDDVETLNLLVRTEKSSKSLKEKIVSLQDKSKDINEDILKTEIKRYQTELSKTDAIQKQTTVMMKGIRGIVSSVEKLPGGGLITSKLGFGQQNLDKIENNLSKWISGGGDLSEIFQGVDDASWKALGRITAMTAGFTLLIAGFKAFKYALTTFSAIADKAGESFGVMGAQDLAGPIQKASVEAQRLGFTVDDVLNFTTSLTANFGFSVKAALELSNKLLESSRAMGLNVEEGSKLFGTLIKIGGLTTTQAKDLAESTYNLARANDINPRVAMLQIADSTEAFATFSKEGGKNVAQAAVNAVKLGTNLNSVQTISDSLLDFQTSLNKEIEAGILLGRDINLQKARELALVDDMSGMMDAVLEQLGGEAEFNELLGYQRKALAAALGIDVATMAKLAANQGDLVTQSGKFVDLIGPEAMSDLTAMFNKLKSIGAQIVENLAGPMKVMLDDFTKFLDHGGWEKINKSLMSIASVIKYMVEHPAAVGALLGFSVGSAFGAKGAGVGALIGATGFGIMGLAKGGSFVTNGPTPIMTGDNPGGRELVTALPLGGALGNLPGLGGYNDQLLDREIGNLKNEMSALRKDMEGYFGFGGTAAKQYARETTRGLESANNRV